MNLKNAGQHARGGTARLLGQVVLLAAMVASLLTLVGCESSPQPVRQDYERPKYIREIYRSPIDGSSIYVVE